VGALGDEGSELEPVYKLQLDVLQWFKPGDYGNGVAGGEMKPGRIIL
jgi:hypothetical protein